MRRNFEHFLMLEDLSSFIFVSCETTGPQPCAVAGKKSRWIRVPLMVVAADVPPEFQRERELLRSCYSSERAALWVVVFVFVVEW